MTKLKSIVSSIGSALRVNGPFNLQLIAKNNDLKVIECNLRVSRSFPFVSKTLDYDFIAAATQVAMGFSPPAVDCTMGVGRIGVKVPQFSFSRLTGADVLLGVEMVSTGEVACFGENVYEAYLKALLSTGFRLPKKNILISVGSYKDKVHLLESVKLLENLGYKLFASRGTADFYSEHNIKIECVDWKNLNDNDDDYSNNKKKKLSPQTSFEKNLNPNNQRNVADYLKTNHFDMFINIPSKASATRASTLISTQGYQTRRLAVDYSVPLMTNVKNVKLLVQSLKAYNLSKPPIKSIIDCISKARTVKLPGLIDVHVHLREPGGCHKEDLITGTSAALAGGITMVCAMPNTDPAIIDEESLKLAEDLYETKALCDYGIYLGATADNSTIIPELANRSCGLKMYLNETFNALKMDKMDSWIKHFKSWPKDAMMCFHAEEHTLAAVLFLAELYDRKVHICHLSTKEDILLIKAAKEKGLKVTCEVAPHHLFFTQQECQNMSSQTKEVRPRLKTEEDRKALWDLLDWIDIFATDHAPHCMDEKEEKGCPGFPGLETSLALLITAYKQGKLTIEQIIQKCYTNPRKIFNLPEQPNTYIEVDLDTEWTIQNETQFTKCKWTPFAGMKVFGKVRRVILRGEVAYVDGQILVKPGYGKNIASVNNSSRLKPTVTVTSVTSDYNSEYNLSIHETESTPKKRTMKTVKSNSSIIEELNQNTKRLGSIYMHDNNEFNENYFQQQQQQQQKQSQKFNYVNQVVIEDQHQISKDEIDSNQSQNMPNTTDICLTQLNMESRPSLADTKYSMITTGQSSLYKSNVISVDNFTKDTLHSLFNLAHDLKVLTLSEKDLTSMLRGKLISLMFFEASTRTQCSFAAAAQRLGGTIVYMDSQHSSIKKGETLEDSVRMMSGYSDLVCIRHPEAGAVKRASKVCSSPLVNAGDGTGEHPTQALLDIFTIREEIGTVNGITITMVGDLKHGRTVHSLAKILKLYRVNLIRYVSPPSLKMPKDIVDALNQAGIAQEEMESLEDALPDTDVLYMTRIQQERFKTDEEYIKVSNLYSVTPHLMTKAKKKMIVMHPLPRVNEISKIFDTDPRAAYFRQAEYGMYVRMALLLMILKQN